MKSHLNAWLDKFDIKIILKSFPKIWVNYYREIGLVVSMSDY